MGNAISSSNNQVPACTFNITHTTSGDRSSGKLFSELFCISYTYGLTTCSLEIQQKGFAKCTKEVRIRLFDNDTVDAHVLVTTNGVSSSSSMTVRNFNLNPEKGVIENWSDSCTSVESIRYLAVERYGLFALIRKKDHEKGVGSDEVTVVQHHYATRNNDGGLFVDVKIKYDRTLRGYVVEVDGPRATHSVSFSNRNEEKDDGSLKQVVGKCRKIKATINSTGYTQGFANHSFFVFLVNVWRNQDSKGAGELEPMDWADYLQKLTGEHLKNKP